MKKHFERYDLKTLIDLLVKRFETIDGVWIFGSRRYMTGSLRSDVDLLVSSGKFIRPSDLRDFSLEHGPALDLFRVDGGTATSCANESHVTANSLDELVNKLDALQLWSRDDGFQAADGFEWSFDIPLGVDFEFTVLNSGRPFAWTWGWAQSKQKYFREIEKEGLPTAPYIGGSIEEVANFIASLIRRLPPLSPSPVKRAKGVTIELRDEYDFQALFYTSVKPWLPELAREEVTIVFDGNQKSADFHLLQNRIVIELKCITDTNSKNLVVKTLEGLKDFYKRNANVRELIFAILVIGNVDLDMERWEEEFSSSHQDVRVRTVVIRHA